jgi:hypothetical protein
MTSFPLHAKPGSFQLGIGVKVAPFRLFTLLKRYTTFTTELAFRKIGSATARAVQTNAASALTAEIGFGKRCFFAMGTTHSDTLYQVETPGSFPRQ